MLPLLKTVALFALNKIENLCCCLRSYQWSMSILKSGCFGKCCDNFLSSSGY